MNLKDEIAAVVNPYDGARYGAWDFFDASTLPSLVSLSDDELKKLVV